MEAVTELQYALNTLWFVLAGALVMWMAAGFAMLEAGSARLEIFEFSSPTPKPSGPNRPVCDHGFTHVGFTVDDVIP